MENPLRDYGSTLPEGNAVAEFFVLSPPPRSDSRGRELERRGSKADEVPFFPKKSPLRRCPKGEKRERRCSQQLKNCTMSPGGLRGTSGEGGHGFSEI